MKRLNVHPGGRYLQWDDDSPFFYLGDTAWELFHRLSREEIAHYMAVRAEQGFNVIQAVALAELGGLTVPNAYGRLPLKAVDGAFDPEQPDVGGEYDYWQHVDWAIERAREHDLFIGLLPTWGDKFNNKRGGGGPEVFTPENAHAYGKWIGSRYKSCWNIIWILGGDRPLETDGQRRIIDAMAEGIKQGDGGAHLMSFHPYGETTSIDFVPEKPYIDFNAIQSGHGWSAFKGHRMLRRVRESEHKPFFNMEPRYEGHPACFTAAFGYHWRQDDVRQDAYWDAFCGACGHTYGHHAIWKFNTQTDDYSPHLWRDALYQPGASQMKFLRQLRESRPFFEFREAPEMVEPHAGSMGHIACGRGERYAFVYSPLGLAVLVHLEQLGGKAVKAHWFDPRSGQQTLLGIYPPNEDALFAPPTQGKGCDWVLVLDAMD